MSDSRVVRSATGPAMTSDPVEPRVVSCSRAGCRARYSYLTRPDPTLWAAWLVDHTPTDPEHHYYAEEKD